LRYRAFADENPRDTPPSSGGQMSAVQLTDEECVRIDSHRTRFKRKLKMGRILAAEELLDEARDAIGEAILSAARASPPPHAFDLLKSMELKGPTGIMHKYERSSLWVQSCGDRG
jgi:hypothetical protein